MQNAGLGRATVTLATISLTFASTATQLIAKPCGNVPARAAPMGHENRQSKGVALMRLAEPRSDAGKCLESAGYQACLPEFSALVAFPQRFSAPWRSNPVHQHKARSCLSPAVLGPMARRRKLVRLRS
jgi:hypothetical protein